MESKHFENLSITQAGFSPFEKHTHSSGSIDGRWSSSIIAAFLPLDVPRFSGNFR